MSHCGDLCVPSAWDCPCPCPQPVAKACSELCVTSCEDSRAVLYPPPVVLTFPGPILTSCPQESLVGSCSPPALGRSGGSRGFGNPVGLRGSILFGGSSSYGNGWNPGRSYHSSYNSSYNNCGWNSWLGRGNCSPFLHRQYSSCSRGSCGPC